MSLCPEVAAVISLMMEATKTTDQDKRELLAEEIRQMLLSEPVKVSL